MSQPSRRLLTPAQMAGNVGKPVRIRADEIGLEAFEGEGAGAAGVSADIQVSFTDSTWNSAAHATDMGIITILKNGKLWYNAITGLSFTATGLSGAVVGDILDMSVDMNINSGSRSEIHVNDDSTIPITYSNWNRATLTGFIVPEGTTSLHFVLQGV